MPITSHQVNEGEPTGEGKVAREKSEREGALARPRPEPRQDAGNRVTLLIGSFEHP